MRNSLIFEVVFYTYPYGKFRVVTQKGQDSSSKGILYENCPIFNRAVPIPKLQSQKKPAQVRKCVGWQAHYQSSWYDSYCFHITDTRYPGGCPAWDSSIPSHFILTLKRKINFKGRSITINTNTWKSISIGMIYPWW